jgi:hypothetical protein
MDTNLETALKAEAKKVIRHFQKYSHEQRADLAANFRAGYQQRRAVGEFFYSHPAVPNRAFPTRGAAARAGLRAQS